VVTLNYIKRALIGQSGTVIGLDYQGIKVLAAYEPVAVLNLGIVAKISLAEIRTPFIQAFLIVLIISFITIVAGTVLFLPLVIPLSEKLKKMQNAFVQSLN